MPPPHQNAPAPPRQLTGPGALQLPFPANPPRSPPVPMPNPPTNANYFGPPTPKGLSPPQWAPGPPPGNAAFATLYLQGIAFDHYMALLQFDPNNPVLSNWLAFTQEFSSKFGIFDTIAEVEENLFNL
ncbi:hypothetical protein C0989_002420 [Termitomyces sp. Mn162]|nr:hypothetical protein C0989_002420 [Termitomyces sp. Mn162]